MHSKISFTGMALDGSKLKTETNMDGEFTKIKLSSNCWGTPFGFRLPKDITNQSDVIKTENGKKISWSKKKVILQNPVNFSNWFTNVENFMLQSVKQGIAQSAKPLVKKNRPTAVVDLTVDDDDVIIMCAKQEKEQACLNTPVRPNSVNIPSSPSQHIATQSSKSTPARSLSHSVSTSQSCSTIATQDSVLDTRATTTCPGASFQPPSGGNSTGAASQSIATTTSSACDSTSGAASSQVASTAVSTQSKPPCKATGTARKHTGPRRHRPSRETEPTASCTANTTFQSTARKRSAPHRIVTPPKKKRSPSPDVHVLWQEPAGHPAPLPPGPDIQATEPHMKELPPKPMLKVSRVPQGIVLSWDMEVPRDCETIMNYQLFAYQQGSAPPSNQLWRKVGDVSALALPMACTLTQFTEGNSYHFSARAMDRHKRVGPFSDASSIHLK